ncbi:MAG: hypothetical protein WC485_01870 [Opitutaceae bacterium]
MPKPNKGESKQDFLKRCTAEVAADGKKADQAYAMCNVFWNEERSTRQALSLSLPVEFTAVGTIDAAKPDQAEVRREFAITAYTGKELETWFGKLVIDVEGIATKEKMPVLREHARDRVVGYGQAFKNAGALYVTGEFSKSTRDAREVLALADEGYPWQASVAVWPTKVMELKDEKTKATVNGREFAGPAEIWLESKVGEVSFVSLGRDDDTAAIVLSAGTDDVPVEIVTLTENKEADIMPITIDQLKADAPEILAQIQKEAADQAAAAERARVSEILAADGDAAVARQAIADGTPAAECFKLFFQAEKQKRADGLKELAAQATPPQGSEEPPAAPSARAAHLQLAERAREIAAEKGINLEEATKLAFQQNRELAKAWVPVQPN